jgi:hypothetical protein
MNLSDELDRLAATTDVPVDVDRVLGRARRLRVTRVVATAGVVVLALLVAAAIPSAWRTFTIQPAAPGRVHVTVTAPSADGANVERVRLTMLHRARAAGLRNPQAGMIDGRTFVFSADSGSRETLLALAQPGELRIRRVLATVENNATTDAVPASPSTVPTLAAVIARLGAAYQVAQGVHDPRQIDDATLARLAPFHGLSAAEVSVLAPEMQYAVPTITCAQLNQRRPSAISAMAKQVAACDPPGYEKYLLDVAVMASEDVAVARPGINGEPNGWVVKLTFSSTGQPKWTELTRMASAAAEPLNQVAFTLDNSVIGAPHVLSEIRGGAEIATDNEQQARLYAALLNEPLRLVELTAS